MLQLYGHFQENHGSETNHSSPKEKKQGEKLFSYLTINNISLKKPTWESKFTFLSLEEWLRL